MGQLISLGHCTILVNLKAGNILLQKFAF